ncbi:MAG: proton-conducting transporter membrane subunit [Chloroflexota bacterium]
MNLPLFLLGILLILALSTYLLRSQETVITALATLVMAGMAIWLWNVDLTIPERQLPFLSQSISLSSPLERFGFTLQLQAGAIPILCGTLGLAAVTFALALRTQHGHNFTPFALLLLAGYVALALLTAGPLSPPLLAPLLFIGLSSLSVFVLQAGRPIRSDGPLRMLIPPVLAFPLFLIGAWYIEQIPLNPQDLTSTQTAAQLLALGMVLLLAPAPLHSYLPDTAQVAPPLVTALLTLLYQLALLHLLFRLVSTFPMVTQQTPIGLWLTWAGLLTAVWGGVAAAGTAHPGRLWGYAALHDWGVILMVLAVPGVRGWPLVLFLYSLRAVSMLTAAVGLSILEEQSYGFIPERLQGIGSRMPWNCAAYLLGGLGLVGFPLSAGFTGHWAALQIAAIDDWRIAAVVLLAAGGAVFGYIRMARLLFGPILDPSTFRENPISALYAVAGILISAALALAPQLLDNPISRALSAFSL